MACWNFNLSELREFRIVTSGDSHEIAAVARDLFEYFPFQCNGFMGRSQRDRRTHQSARTFGYKVMR